jgi:BlaI family penicillinase repressor
MSKKKASPALQNLSKRESQIMELLYGHGASTVARVADLFPEPLSRNALRTFLGILENKGCVTRTKEGREFIYAPTTEHKEAANSALSKVLNVFFKGSLSDAVAASFTGTKEKIDEDELSRLEALIAQARKQNKSVH